MITQIKNTEQLQQVATLFNRLSVLNAELETISIVCTEAQQKEVQKVFSIELQKKLPEKPQVNLTGNEEMQPILILQGNGIIPPQFENMISEQIKNRNQYETQRFDYVITDSQTFRVMAVIANELKAEREIIFTELEKYNILINGI